MKLFEIENNQYFIHHSMTFKLHLWLTAVCATPQGILQDDYVIGKRRERKPAIVMCHS